MELIYYLVLLVISRPGLQAESKDSPNAPCSSTSRICCTVELLTTKNYFEFDVLQMLTIMPSPNNGSETACKSSNTDDKSHLMSCTNNGTNINVSCKPNPRGTYYLIRINCSDQALVNFQLQDLHWPFYGIHLLYKRLHQSSMRYEVSATFPKVDFVDNKHLSDYSRTYVFSGETHKLSLELNITSPNDSSERVTGSPSLAGDPWNENNPICIRIFNNEAKCNVLPSNNDLYFVNVGGDNLVETSYLKTCLNPELEHTCGNKKFGTTCRSNRYCKKIARIHQNGVIRCAVSNYTTKDLEYFQDIDADLHTNMSNMWNSDLLIRIEEEDNSSQFEIKTETDDGNENEYDENDEMQDELTYCPHVTRLVPVQRKNVTVLYDQQDSRFECHFLDYFLVQPVIWRINWENGSSYKHFGGNEVSNKCILKTLFEVNSLDSADNINNETRFVADENESQKQLHFPVKVKSSHFRFQASLGITNISCEMYYWNSSKLAESTQVINVTESNPPKFSPHEVDHVEKTSTLKLQCVEYESMPPATYIWKFDANEEKGTPILSEGDSQRNSSVLTLFKVGEMHSGNYVCIASNFKGNASKVFRVNVDNVDRMPILGIIGFAVLTFLQFSFVALCTYRYFTRASLSQKEIIEFQSSYDPKIEVPWANFDIDYDNELGGGCHGFVYKGTIAHVPIAVKTLKRGIEKEVLKSFLDELNIVAYLGRHDYIVDLKGACTEFLNEGRAYILVEYCSFGSIQSFIQNNKSSFRRFPDENEGLDGSDMGSTAININAFSQQHLVLWSVQIAKGMQYLEEKEVIHGDLAIRNILMRSLDHVKIADFSLSRRLNKETNYVQMEKTDRLPWRYMSIEALKTLRLTTKTDVWSYGVTIWEIFTLGETPYPEMEMSSNFVKLLEANLRCFQPIYASVTVYRQLMKCWEAQPENRPSFKELYNSFSGFLEA